MTFFDSEVVRAEIVHINELQEKLYSKMFSFYSMNKQDKLDHVELLKTLIDKQKVWRERPFGHIIFLSELKMAFFRYVLSVVCKKNGFRQIFFFLVDQGKEILYASWG